MASGQGRNSQNMDIILSGLASCLARRLEQWANVYIKTEIGKAGSNHLSTPVVAILPKFCNHNPWATALLLRKLISQLAGHLEIIILLAYFASVYTTDNAVRSLVAAKMALHSCTDFTQGSTGTSGHHGQLQ